MTHVPVEELEALAFEELEPARSAAVAAHVEGCADCSRELSWLRAEKALLARRPAAQTSHLWPGVAARLRHPRRRPRWAWRIAVAGAGVAAAAAVLLVALHPAPPPLPAQQAPVARRQPRFAIDPKTLAALDRAEHDYGDAAKVLEEEYGRLRPHLDPELARRWDETLTRARAQLGESRAVAADDVNARMRVLDGYAGYLRALRDVVQAEEANP
jgi:hypothetical protein